VAEVRDDGSEISRAGAMGVLKRLEFGPLAEWDIDRIAGFANDGIHAGQRLRAPCTL
jgi:hypothetical protein